MGNNTKYSAVTTFNLEKHPYGIEMINSFFLNWPDEIQLTAYIENSLTIDSSIVKKKKLLLKNTTMKYQSILNFVKNIVKKKKNM